MNRVKTTLKVQVSFLAHVILTKIVFLWLSVANLFAFNQLELYKNDLACLSATCMKMN